MTDQDIRMKCLELAMPKSMMNPDPGDVINRARAFYFFVTDTPIIRGPVEPTSKPADTGKASRKT